MVIAGSARTKALRCCHLTSAHPPFDPRIFHKECVSLAEAGYDVSLVSPHDRHQTERNVRIIPVGRPGGRLRRFGALPWRIVLAALRERADIYHFHDPDLVPVGLLLKFLGKRVVYDVHEDSAQTILSRHWIPSWARPLLSACVGRFEKLAAGAFDAVVVATPHLERSFQGCNKVSNVKNYPRIADSELTSDSGDVLTFVYVGGLEEARGISEMVRALGIVSKACPATLELIGNFTEAQFESEVQQLPEWGHVRYLGRLPFETIPGKLAEAHVGIACLHPLPRFVVSYPTKLFEYMAAGLPVIASDFPLWREFVEDAGCGLLVDPLDPEAIAAAMLGLANDPAMAKGMGAAGRTFAQRHYNWKSEETKLLAAYDAVLAVSPERRGPRVLD